MASTYWRMVGGEIGGTGELDTINGTVTANSTVKKTGGYSIAITGFVNTNNFILNHPSNTDAVSGRFQFRTTDPTSIEILEISNGGLTAGITTTASDELRVIVSGGTGDNGSVISADTWYEIKFKYDTSGGSGNVSLEVQLDGVADCASTDGTDTANVQALRFNGPAASVTNYFDDVRLEQDSATVWVTSGEIFALPPDADSSVAGADQFVDDGAAAQTFDNVDEIVASDTDYATEDGGTGTTLTRQRWEMDQSAIASGYSGVNHVELYARVRRKGGAARSHHLSYANQATLGDVEDSADLDPGTSYALYSFNPSASFQPTSISDLSNDEIGGEVNGVGGQSMYISWTTLVVDVEPETSVELTLSASDDVDNLADAFASFYVGVLPLAQADSINNFADDLTRMIYHRRYMIADSINNFNDARDLLYHRNYQFADDIDTTADALRLVYGRNYEFTDDIDNFNDALLTQLFVTFSINVADSIDNYNDAIRLIYDRRYTFADTINFLTDAERLIYERRYLFADDVDNFNDALLTQLFVHLERTFSDSINNWNDALRIIYGRRYAFTDDIDNYGDALRLIYGRRYLFSDDIDNFLDAYAQSLDPVGGGDLTLSVADDIDNYLDAFSAIYGRRYLFTDDVDNYNDAFGVIYGRDYAFSDNIDNYNDGTTFRYDYLIPFSDQFVISDSFTLFAAYSFAHGDAITITDDTRIVLGYLLAVIADDINNLVDAFAASLEDPIVQLNVSESDNIDNFLDAVTIIQDGIHLADSINNYADSLILHIPSLHFTGDSINNWLDALETLMEKVLTVNDGIPALRDRLEALFALVLSESDDISGLADSFASSLSGSPGLSPGDDIDNYNDNVGMALNGFLDIGDLWNSVLDDNYAAVLNMNLEIGDSYTITDGTVVSGGLELTLSVSDDINNLADAINSSTNTRGVGVGRGEMTDYIRRYLNDVVT
jgi:hypothetical protein